MTKCNLYNLGRTIRKYRLLAGLSQEALSERIECDKNTIGRIERGESDFKISMLIRLAQGLDVTLTRLSREIEIQHTDCYAATLEYDYLRLYQYCRKLSPEQFNNLCNTAHIYAKGNESTGS